MRAGVHEAPQYAEKRPRRRFTAAEQSRLLTGSLFMLGPA